MKLKFHPAARIELNEAVDYYEERRSGLGWEFYEEVQDTIRRILGFPGAWQRLSAKTRRCLTNRFPYGVVYQVEADEVRIVAISHQSRKPGYWRGRLHGS
ncbi:MAG: type II toxin-antitoxin system RelE/ParE family toxin [bacterium]|nr:type II toxin-antitoxin system RelE/ParE family toxin [bacterium]